MALCLFMCATGAGLIQSIHSISTTTIIHALCGLLAYFMSCYIYFYWDAKNVMRVSRIAVIHVSITVLFGCLCSHGLGYLSKPTAITNSAALHSELVAPLVIEKKCISCHNTSLAQGSVDLSTPAGLEKVIVRKNPNHSLLFLSLNAPLNSVKHMPYSGGQLNMTEIDEVKRWILALSSHATVERKVASQDARLKHWTFTPFVKSEIPKVSGSYVQNEIDKFIINTVAKKTGFQLNKLDAYKLTRRISLITTGLPPSVQEIKDVQSGKISAKEFINRCVSSKEFSVNFSNYWLDLIGFADDNGIDGVPKDPALGQKFRNYLLTSLDGNPSYFKFLKEQIKPSKTGKTDNYQSMIMHLPHQIHPEATMDHVINSLFSFSLGVEMRCARCHDHPIEPISNENYYQLVRGFGEEFDLNDPNLYFDRKQKSAMPKSQLPGLFSNGIQKDFSKISHVSDWLRDTESGAGFFTARVFVDNVWRFVFGKGLLTNAGDFGLMSAAPSHLALLNWLTHDFIEHDTSIKYLITKMLNSAVFQGELSLSDPKDLSLLGVYKQRLLSSENIRDNFLKVSGVLTQDRYVTSARIESGYLKHKSGPSYRTFYYPRNREIRGDSNNFNNYFGFPARYSVVPARPDTIDLSSEMFFMQAPDVDFLIHAISTKLLASESKGSLVNKAYETVLARGPNEKEKLQWNSFFLGKDDPEQNLKVLFQVLISSNDFLYIQ